jgi:AGZA family xanthine/uracil permease-like MFS transporter
MLTDGTRSAPVWWALARGDVDTTIAQVGLNLAQAIIPVFLLAPLGIPVAFSVSHLLPGYSLGFLVGSCGLVALARGLARRERRLDVTAHGFGNNVPAIITFTLFIIAPAYLQSGDAGRAVEIGAAAVVWTGAIKLGLAPFARVLRRIIPVPAAMTVFGAAMYSYLALVLLQRIFDDPLVGIVAFAIVAVAVQARVPITSWKIPPFVVVWLVPLALGIAVGYVRPAWPGISPGPPFVASFGPLRSLMLAFPYMSAIAPIALYEVLQDIAAVEGASAAGDDYDARAVVACDGLGTLVAGAAGSVIPTVVYAVHPAYKAIGARIAFAFWAPVIFIVLAMSGLTPFMAQLFPWSILSAMISYFAIGVGAATLGRVDRRYLNAVLLGFVLPAGAVVSAAVGSAIPALRLSLADPAVQKALDTSIYWASVQGLGNGFLFLVLVVAAMIAETIDRHFVRAATWCLVAAALSWFGLMHSAVVRWGAQPRYAAGWVAAAAIVYTARWWTGERRTA